MNGDIVTGLLRRAAWAQIAVMAGVLVLALAWMEPSGGAGLGFGAGLVFHALHIGPACCVAWWCSGWLLRTPAGGRGSPWPWLVLAGAVAGAVLAPWSLWLEQMFGVIDDDAPAGGLAATLRDEWSQVVPLTAILWPAMNLLVVWRQAQPAPRLPLREAMRAADGPSNVDPSPPAQPVPGLPAQPAPALTAQPDPRPPAASLPAPPPPVTVATATGGFLDRLPHALGRDVVWLQAQEHYLSVTTSRGHHLLLQAFGPAVADLDRLGIDGMQIHRSAWVAWAHVRQLDSRARSPAIVLRDGTRLAVGRRRLPDVVRAWAARESSAPPAAYPDSSSR